MAGWSGEHDLAAHDLQMGLRPKGAPKIPGLQIGVRTFSGDMPQADDMTCVVVKVEE